MGRWGPEQSEGPTYSLRVIKSLKSPYSQRLTSLELTCSNGQISRGLLSRVQLPFFLDYSAPLFSSHPRIDRTLYPGLGVILGALK